MKKNLYPAVSMAFILIIWQIVVIVWKIPAFILPGPAAVFSALAADAQVLLSHSVTTLNEAVLGLVIASVLSFITALAMDYWKFLEMSFYPLLVISQMLPIMVLGPLLTLWFGFGMLPKVILVVLISYFPIVVSFSDTLRKVSKEQIIFLKTMGADTGKIYRIYKIPAGLSGFFSGLKVAATYCVSGAVVGEWLSAQAGLGYYMIRVKNSYQIDKVFAAIICVILFSYMPQEDMLLPWLSVYQNVTLYQKINHLTINEEQVRDYLDIFGLNGYEHFLPEQLSGGMKQRTALLRTIMNPSSYLLLDEPFGALDAMTRGQMQDWMLKLPKKAKRTTLLVTHDIEEAIYLSDRILVLSARPAHVIAEIQVPEKRRSREWLLQQSELKQTIYQLLAGELDVK